MKAVGCLWAQRSPQGAWHGAPRSIKQWYPDPSWKNLKSRRWTQSASQAAGCEEWASCTSNGDGTRDASHEPEMDHVGGGSQEPLSQEPHPTKYLAQGDTRKREDGDGITAGEDATVTHQYPVWAHSKKTPWKHPTIKKVSSVHLPHLEQSVTLHIRSAFPLISSLSELSLGEVTDGNGWVQKRNKKRARKEAEKPPPPVPQASRPETGQAEREEKPVLTLLY